MAYRKHDNSQIRSPEAKENGQAGSNADQLCSWQGKGERQDGAFLTYQSGEV